MKEERDTKVEDDDGPPQATPFPARPSETMGQPSMMLSLRSIVTSGSKESGDDDDDDDDDDSFVFTDKMHHHQEFGQLFGFTDESGNHKTKAGKGESTQLLNQRKSNVKQEEIKTQAEETKYEPHGISMYRRESKMIAYQRGQKELLLEVLDQVDKIQNTTRKHKGFKVWKFALGLVNCLLVTYVFGSHPEHFWILYAIETIFWMSYKFRGMYFAKPLSEALYYLDFCWIMNILGVSVVLVMIFLDGYLTSDIIPIEVRRVVFLACFGVFCGPVFMAAMVLPFVAFLFHDVNTMANLIIHLMPSMVMYNYRWHAVEICSAYPNLFPHLAEFTEEINNSKNSKSLMQITLAVYFAWFIPYTIWMLLVGLKLPVISKDKEKPPPKYDTVFHSTWKGGMCELAGTALWKRPKDISRDCSERNDYEIRDFLLYMAGHAVGCCGIGTILIGDILCFSGGKPIHAALLWFVTIVCAKRGADRYTYYVTSMYGQKLRKAFREIEAEHQQELQKLKGANRNYDSIEE